MRRFLRYISTLTLFFSSTWLNAEMQQTGSPFLKSSQPDFALINVDVIDGTGATVKRGQTVIVRNGLIDSVGPVDEVPINSGLTLINGEGKTLIPGIVGVHNHLFIPGMTSEPEHIAFQYFAWGVTTLQTAGAAQPELELELSEKAQRQELIAPTIIPSGPYITGPGGNPNMIQQSREKLEQTLQLWHDRGIRWFKVYRHTRKEDLATVVKFAKNNQSRVTGHLCSITFEQALQLGINGIHHGLNSLSDYRSNKSDNQCNGGREYIDTLDLNSEAVRQLHELMIEQDVFLVSTLSIYESSVKHRIDWVKTFRHLMPPAMKQRLDSDLSVVERIDTVREARLKRIMTFEKLFVERGGLLGSGVDAGRVILPGVGDLRNYELFLEAGFSAELAIKIMTSNGANILQRPNIGTIEVKKVADMVLIDGDVIETPQQIYRIDTVFKAGKAFDAQAMREHINNMAN